MAYILNNTKGVTSSQICGITLQGNGCSGGQLSLQWSVDVDPGPKPETNTANSSEANVRASTYATFPAVVHFHILLLQSSKYTPFNMITDNNIISVKYKIDCLQA